MSYQHFAMLYDELMEEVPYHLWIRYIEDKINRYGNGGKRILDLGSGTGSISIPLALQGYEVTAVDLSDEMLAIAQEKALEARANIELIQQDMRELSGFQPFDCIGIFCDSLNYLKSEEDVILTFKNVRNQLSAGGLFLFDVHSTYKIDELFVGQTYARNEEDICYIWNCFQGEEPHSVEHELTFFVMQDNFLYQRFDELHYQRTFSIIEYEQMLHQAGFKVLEVSADFKEEQPNTTSERILFAATKL